MGNQITRNVLAALLLALVALPVTVFGQTFRGGINGTVFDSSGAVVAGAQVVALQVATNITYEAVSSSAGEFALTNLPLGDYTVTVSAIGFGTVKVEKVTVTAGVSYTLPVKLNVATSTSTVEVTGDQLSLDTVTDEQAIAIPDAAVQNLPNSGRDFTQMLAQTAGFAGFSGSGGSLDSSVNGTRTNSINWQIEGTDNNDLWWNIPAVNQSGVNGISAVIMPIDAIENFSFVTSGTTEIGRNAGGTANISIKSGTNTVHGSAYYFNHNEFFQANNPFESIKEPARDQHYGFSVGAPIWKNKTFFFLSGEKEWFLLGAGLAATEPTTDYQTDALSILSAYGVTPNPLAHTLLYGNSQYAGLWPTSALASTATTGLAVPDNYSATGNTTGYSYNFVSKFDENLTEKDHIAFTWFIGQGIQIAPLSSALTPYFQNAGTHIQNYSLVYNRLISSSMDNQLSAGVSYFNQVFDDNDTSFNPVGLGLNTGVTAPDLLGSPHLVIGPVSNGGALVTSNQGFDPLGVTAPEGRNDITGHLDEDLTWTKGAHQMHFGGEYRQAQVDEFYLTGQRGTIYFDGTQGPWSTTNSACAAYYNSSVQPNPSAYTGNELYLADFLAGCFDPNATQIVLGNPKRQVFLNTFSLYAQDSWQARQTLSLNYGLRYDYESPVHSDYHDLSIFDPSLSNGLAVAGVNVPYIYPRFWGGISPRVGFSYQLGKNDKTVLRGGYGLYYDSVYMKSILQDTGAQNISDFGPSYNPAGSSEVAQASAIPMVLQSGVPFYETYTQALAGQGITNISTFDQHFRPSYMQQIDLNIQHRFTSTVVAQVGYVGTKGTHLLGIFDINPGALNSLNVAVPYSGVVPVGSGMPNAGGVCSPTYSGATPTTPGNDLQCSRPYFGQFPNFGVIDEERTNLGSNYNSLQASLKLQNWKGFAGSGVYTWAHALDYETGSLPYLPQNPLAEKPEYGNSDFDVRQTLTGYLDYNVPTFRGPSKLTRGWALNSGFSFHGGMPFTVTSNANPSGNGENADRAVQEGNPFAGVNHAITNGVVQWFNPTAPGCNNCFVDAALGTYSTTRRGQNYNPGYEAVDLAVVKITPIRDNIKAQFRADMFNIFNHVNMAPVGLPTTGETGVISSTIGSYLGNPAVGPGEPFNVLFSLKILF